MRASQGTAQLSSSNPPSCVLPLAQEGPGEYDSTDKLYVSIQRAEDFEERLRRLPALGSIDDSTAESLDTGLCGTVFVHRRTSSMTYERTSYKIMGPWGPTFLEALSKVRASVLLPICCRSAACTRRLSGCCCWRRSADGVHILASQRAYSGSTGSSSVLQRGSSNFRPTTLTSRVKPERRSRRGSSLSGGTVEL